MSNSETYKNDEWETIFDPENKEKIVIEKNPLEGKCLI